MTSSAMAVFLGGSVEGPKLATEMCFLCSLFRRSYLLASLLQP
jgi:hypothetical protein